MRKILMIPCFWFISSSSALSQNKSVNKASGNSKTATAKKAIIVKKKPGCNSNDYFPLCSEMKYVYREVNALQMEYDYTQDYKYFTTVSNNGKTFYGYVLNSRDDKGENFYYSIEDGFLSEHYEIPDVTEEYIGSSYQTPPLFAPIWHPGTTTDYYETHVDYNSGNFRSIKLLSLMVAGDSTWSEKTTVDKMPSVITTKIIRRIPSFSIGSVHFEDLILLQRDVESKSFIGDKKSSQEIIYAKGVGIIAIQDIGKREHLLSDFVKPNRRLISYTRSGQPEIVIKPEAYDQLFYELILDRNPAIKHALDEQKRMKDEKLKAKNSPPVVLSGKIDGTIIGTWKRSNVNLTVYNIFKSDGSGEVYTGTIDPENCIQKFSWRINGNVIEKIQLELNGVKTKNSTIQISRFRKLNHPDDGRKIITIDDYFFYKIDDKSPFEVNNKIEEVPDSLTRMMNTEMAAFKGKVSEDLLGSWKRTNPWRHPDNGAVSLPDYYIFFKDGTYKHYYGGLASENSTSIDKSYWRIDSGFIELLSFIAPFKIVRSSFKKSGDKILIGSYEYVFVSSN